MKFSELHPGEFIGKDGPDGELWEIVWVGPTHAVIRQVISIRDLEGWQKIDLYGHVSKSARGEPIK